MKFNNEFHVRFQEKVASEIAAALLDDINILLDEYSAPPLFRRGAILF